MKRITIKEIAKKAGVSVGTVDRVLHNRGEVAESTRELVKKIAEEGNYSTNVYARTLKLNKVFNIALIIPQDNEYWQVLRKGIERAANEYESLGLQVQDFTFDRRDQQSFLDMAEQAIASKPEGVVMAPLVQDAVQICQKMNEASLPYVFVDSNLQEAHPLCFVGQDTVQSGFLAAKLINYGKEVGEPVYVLKYSDFDIWNKTVSERIEGFKTYYDQRSWDRNLVREIEILEGDENLAQLEELREPGLRVFIPNSRSNEVNSFLAKKGIKPKRMIGYDLTQANARVIEQGGLDFIINQHPIQQGYLSIQALYKNLIASTDVDKDQLMPIEIVTRENLEFANVFYL